MEPRIQFTRTSDGVSIAYWTMGVGTPVIVTPPYPWSHIQMELENPLWRKAYDRMSQHRMIVRYDCRGCGLSTPKTAEISADNYVTDLEAVAAQLNLTRHALIACGNWGPFALTYAARHPDRVSRLILWGSFPRYAPRAPQHDAALALVDRDWRLYTETFAQVILGWDDPEQTRWFAKYIRASINRETYQAAGRTASRADATSLLARVLAPTLVLQRRHAWPYVEEATQLASKIPNSQIVLLDGKSTLPFAGDFDAVLQPIEEFLGSGSAPRPPSSEAPSETAIILFADVVDSTAITARMGNQAFRERTRQLEEGLRGVIRDAGGSPVAGRTLGDGVLGDFSSAAQAITAALLCEEQAEGVGLQLHLGIHAGDVMREPGGGVSGIAVSIASRISDLTGPNEIFVSSTVRDLARASTGVTFEDRGEHALKGIEEPQRVFAVLKHA